MEKLQVNIVIEIMGRPKEHLQEALQSLFTRMASEKGIKILEKEIHEPIEVKDSNLFTAFMELTLELDSFPLLTAIVFTYMPSHIELIKPERITLSNYDLNDMSNAIIQRLHHYDSVAKQMLAEKEILMKKLYEVAPHLFKKENQQSIQGVPATKPKVARKKTKKLKKK